MGLDATVYRSLEKLPPHLRQRVSRDPESGELSWLDFADEKLFRSAGFDAWHEHIGNIAMVAFLREEIAQLFGNQESLLSRKVVYSGSHAGDFIPFSDISELNREIDELELLITHSQAPELTTFIEKMRKLISAANRERNGIVF